MILKYEHSTIQFINCVMEMFIFDPKGREYAYPLRGQGKVTTFKDSTIWPEKASVGSSQANLEDTGLCREEQWKQLEH